MLNYYLISTEAYERQCLLQANAQQWHLAQIVPAPPHPLMVWIGQRLIRWGQQLQTQTPQRVGPSTSVAGIR